MNFYFMYTWRKIINSREISFIISINLREDRVSMVWKLRRKRKSHIDFVFNCRNINSDVFISIFKNMFYRSISRLTHFLFSIGYFFVFRSIEMTDTIFGIWFLQHSMILIFFCVSDQKHKKSQRMSAFLTILVLIVKKYHESLQKRK